MTFEESMWKCNTRMDSSKHWVAIKKAYNDYYLNYAGEKTQKIPKIIHQIWLGSPFPDKYKLLTDRWQEMHPDWTIMLWDEKKIEDFGLANKWMYDNMRNPSAKSDVVRYEVAYSYGGIYVDTDFLCCKNFDKLLYLDFFCGIIGSYDNGIIDTDTCLAPSIFGCSQGNKLIEKVILRIGEQTVIPRSIPEIMTITGPEMFSRVVIDEFGKHPFSVAFPPNYCYPFPGQQRENIRTMSSPEMQRYLSHYTYAETYAIHLWYCSWQKHNLLT